MPFAPDEIEQMRTVMTETLRTQLPTILQPMVSKQESDTQLLLSAIKNHVSSAVQTIRRVLGK